MTRSNLKETLHELSCSPSSRSQTAQLREVFDDVEKALNAGVSRKAVHKALLDDGFTMSFSSFENALHRIRKRHERLQLPKKAASTDNSQKPEKKKSRFGQGAPDPNADERRDTVGWESVPNKEKLYGKQ
ncbi:hypothetical protein [Pseudomonas protegens]|uniref:hypothetical protein n=1 Tax=Pseudomonas protegens TaxID=380021 RepID=UPI0011B297E5|nr:hypothetical protein [Pseudomonas protegens]